MHWIHKCMICTIVLLDLEKSNTTESIDVPAMPPIHKSWEFPATMKATVNSSMFVLTLMWSVSSKSPPYLSYLLTDGSWFHHIKMKGIYRFTGWFLTAGSNRVVTSCLFSNIAVSVLGYWDKNVDILGWVCRGVSTTKLWGTALCAVISHEYTRATVKRGIQNAVQ